MKIRNNAGTLGPKNTPSTASATGVWSVQELYQNQRDGTWPTAVDPSGDINYNQTSLLLHGDGTNGAQNNTFLDGSPNAFTITRNGNTTQGTFSPFSKPNGSWSIYFNGSNTRYFTIPYTATTFGTGDFTVECWVYINSFEYGGVILDTRSSATANPFVFGFTTGGVLLYYNGTEKYASPTVQLNQWTHVCVSRSSGTIKMFINGVQGYSATDTSNLTGTSTTTAKIGDAIHSVAPLWGYISNYRIVKGTGLYTSNFTPSTSPLTAITNTSLLTFQSNRFIDNSSNAVAITPNGTPSVETFSPFAPTSAYSAATNGGSAYFDGSGDYLSVASNNTIPKGNESYTIESWFYFTGATQTIVSWGEETTNKGFGLRTNDTGNGMYHYWWANDLDTGNIALQLNTWNHVAAQFDGTTRTIYVNGVLRASDTPTGHNVTVTNNLKVGVRINGSSEPANGYISNLRIITNSALYTTTFTPPTAPLTAITGTSFLLSATNAGIIDNTAKNNLETVGNAQISTTQKKFGTASMYFDGTNSYLISYSKPVLGTQDWTFEGWIYPTSTPTCGLLTTTTTSGYDSGNIRIGLYLNKLYFDYYGTGGLNNTGPTVPTNTWSHVAFVRSGATIYAYFNGNLVGSYTYSTTTSITGPNWMIGRLDTSGSSYFPGYMDDLRLTVGVARYLYNFTPPTKTFPDYGTLPTSPSNDSYFGSTPLLLHGDGSSGTQNQTFLDSSTNAFTVTRNGNATQGTFSPFSRADGYWSNYFSGSDYLSIASNAALSFGTGDFTIETWIYLTSYSNYGGIFQNGSAANGSIGLYTIINTGKVELSLYGTINFDSVTAVPLNQWTHIAAVRSGSNLYIFINGKLDVSTTTSFNNTSSTVQIGYTWGTSSPAIYISNLRVVKGTAVYTSSFTPSTTPLTAISGTSLLTCQSNRFIDNSTNAFAITASGSPSVQPFIPFEPTTAYSASVNGGSGYFDGSGDYLTLPAGSSWLFTGDHCLEAWVYWTVSQGSIIYATGNASSADQFGLFPSGEGIWWGQTSQSSSVVPTLNAWNHVCVTRQGTTIRRFLNGKLITTATVSGNIGSNSATPYIGIRPSGGTTFTGNISNLRIINGSVPTDYQTSNTTANSQIFTPSTAPFTTTSQGATSGDVKLLLSGTNAGIIDNTASNVLETGGNAQASAVQYKYGTGSMYFDGSGDYLDTQSTPQFNFGSGDFTIEGWLYWDSSKSSLQVFVDFRPTSTNGYYPCLYLNTSGQIIYYVNGSAIITSSAITASTWTHFALVKYSGVTKIYINGNQGGSSADTNTYVQSRLRIGNSGYSLADAVDYKGYIDDLRITKGTARYIYNFQPPTAAYPDY